MADFSNFDRRLRKSERRERILLDLKLQPHVRISDLAVRFGVTTETIRRDIEDLSRDGLLHRAYGGASAPFPGSHRHLDDRRKERLAEREEIARAAASLIEEGETLMIDAGATTLALAQVLAYSSKSLTALTNSVQVAMSLGRNANARVLLAPGRFMVEEAATVGTETADFIGRYNADRCFIGASGIAVPGVTEAIDEFAPVKRAMLRQCRQRYLLVDSSKFSRVDFSVVDGLEWLTAVLSDRHPEGELARALDRADVDVISTGDDPLPEAEEQNAAASAGPP
ncbi:DeoR/GlpR family DNA-binding transcription regulator [Tranquillimonas alkanivorans]|uniref:Transcriptional regulator, DeoR family n=1 Tax=Tranquillimonas alkanivorans TaxID=441119 RepID=A0A1I5UHK2_9RHOB|nr:DeoR/GlpR family DNA-binding transcription regulator [Tranquillimonas alkanivorans]SFP94527.1 transcriptional regulator, DeoR family [Tranquillimonas alkanivorans]